MSVYCCSDFHGMYDLWKQVQNFLQENDTLYFLGDAADRGPDGYKIMKELLADKRVIYIKGNHEKFFADAIDEYLYYEELNYPLWTISNGGAPTFEAAMQDDVNILRSFNTYIEKLPLFVKYINKDGYTIYLSHAGFTPDDFDKLVENDFIWGRKHFYRRWPEGYDEVFIVHGHTPTPILKQEFNTFNKHYVNNDGAIFYCNGHKIDIDCGAFATNATVLLDLDTFETFPIKSANMTEDQAKLLYD